MRIGIALTAIVLCLALGAGAEAEAPKSKPPAPKAAGAVVEPACPLPAIISSGRVTALIFPGDVAALTPEQQRGVRELLNSGNVDLSFASDGRALLLTALRGTKSAKTLARLFDALDRQPCR